MKIATFNANSVRVRLPILLDWLATHEPDVLALQEIKCEDHVFPANDFLEIGYRAEVFGQKSYNGVALLSKVPLNKVIRGYGDDARILCAEVDGIWIVNTYVPNGTKVGGDKWDYKLAWLDRFRDFVGQSLNAGVPTIWLGDINIAPEAIDVYDSAKVKGGVGHHPDEFSRLAAITEQGLHDVFRKHHPEGGHYTYWDFFIKNALDRKLGWRIDHIYATEDLAARCSSCEIDTQPRRAERPSDHTFVIAEF
jgi:exodeoxyribonuclease-3